METGQRNHQPDEHAQERFLGGVLCVHFLCCQKSCGVSSKYFVDDNAQQKLSVYLGFIFHLVGDAREPAAGI